VGEIFKQANYKRFHSLNIDKVRERVLFFRLD
jgi:hypothetical protein